MKPSLTVGNVLKLMGATQSASNPDRPAYGCAMNSARTTRREALRHLGAGALLALGLWPGALRAEGRGRSGAFRFLQVNDTHCLSSECGEYLAGVVRQMNAERADFCLLAGDLTDQGDRRCMATVKEVFAGLNAPMYPVIGNHDHLTPTDRTAYTDAFPKRVNHHFEHAGWQFLGLDTTEGQRYEKTTIQPATLRWVSDTLPRLDPRKPTVIFTHFPLGIGTTPAATAPDSLAGLMQDFSTALVTVKYRPLNADDLLDRFREFNLRAVFSGHYHAFTECRRGETVFTTDRCCALKRANHDGSKAKGYFVCDARDERLERRFVEFKTPATLAAVEAKP